MKTFKKIEMIAIQAVQYGIDKDAENYVELCKADYNGEVYALPKDLLGSSKDAFSAVNTQSGFVKIQPSDWIVRKNNELFVIPNGIFKCMFEEI